MKMTMYYFPLLSTGFLLSLCIGGCTATCLSARLACDACHRVDASATGPHSILESDLFESLQLNAFRPFVVSGSSRAIDPNHCITIFNVDSQLDSLLSFLTSQGIPLKVEEAGNTVVSDSTNLRRALSKYIEIIVRRSNIIAQNIANVDTLQDLTESPLAPYRRQVLVVGDDGSGTIERDPSPFRLEWRPDDPLALKEGPDAGYVRCPNVDLVQEAIDLVMAEREYQAVQEIIRELYRCPL